MISRKALSAEVAENGRGGREESSQGFLLILITLLHFKTQVS
jgi:hypothetical protein